MLEAYVCCLTRSLAFCQLAPVVGDDEVPFRARLALSAVLATFLVPAGQVHQGSLVAGLAMELAVGLTMGGILCVLWRTLDAVLIPVASSLAAEEPREWATLSRLVGISAFLACSGDHYLIYLLAAPPSSSPSGFLGVAWLGAGRMVFQAACDALLPLLGVLVTAQLLASLVARGASIDLTSIARPFLLALVFVVAISWISEAPGPYEDVLSGHFPDQANVGLNKACGSRGAATR